MKINKLHVLESKEAVCTTQREITVANYTVIIHTLVNQATASHTVANVCVI